MSSEHTQKVNELAISIKSDSEFTTVMFINTLMLISEMMLRTALVINRSDLLYHCDLVNSLYKSRDKGEWGTIIHGASKFLKGQSFLKVFLI